MKKVIFLFDGKEDILECSEDELMKDICQKYINKIDKDINSLTFIYEEKQINFNLSFNDQINTQDKEKNEMKVLVNKKESKNIKNFITAEINIKEKDINKKIRILNSYEEYFSTKAHYPEKECFNENEIKKCEITIDEKLIPFSYFYIFESKGKHIIKYSFKDNITKTLFMFQGCDLLTNINLSNFNSNNITNMRSMFNGCSSLTYINLFNFNTKNVTNKA